MRSSIFSLNRNVLGAYVDSFIAYKESFASAKSSFLTHQHLVKETADRKLYVTDLDRDMTYYGTVESLKTVNGSTKVSLIDVQVYQYSSSNPLFDLPKITLARPEDKLYIEECE